MSVYIFIDTINQSVNAVHRWRVPARGGLSRGAVTLAASSRQGKECMIVMRCAGGANDACNPFGSTATASRALAAVTSHSLIFRRHHATCRSLRVYAPCLVRSSGPPSR